MTIRPSPPAALRRLALLCAAALLAACASTRGGSGGGDGGGGGGGATIPYGAGDKPAPARATDAGRASLRPVEGVAVVEGDTSTFTAWFADDAVRLVEERRPGIAGTGTTGRFYWDGDRLIYAETVARRAGATTADPMEVTELRVPFDEEGRPAAPRKVVSDRPFAVERAEAAALRQRAELLADAAREASNGAGASAGGRFYGYEGGLKDATDLAGVYERASRFWRKVEGTWQGARFQGTLTAYYDDAALRRLEVEYEPREGSEARETGSGAFTFDTRGRLFFYAGTERQRTGSGRNVRTTAVRYQVALNARGEVGAVRKAVGRAVRPLEPAEIERLVGMQEVARRAAAIARAQAEGGGTL